MKKSIGIIVALILFVAASFTSAAQASGNDENVRKISKSLKALALGVELWANAHHGKYPTSYEFYSDEFLKYVKKVDREEAKNNLCCPLSGRCFNYARLQKEKDYIISCPVPYNYGMKTIYYQRSKGVVTEVPLKN
ncbi:MAG: hypothetical protein AB2L14_05380 [Candidatus Xenobiia bacterium LiM19]